MKRCVGPEETRARGSFTVGRARTHFTSWHHTNREVTLFNGDSKQRLIQLRRKLQFLSYYTRSRIYDQA